MSAGPRRDEGARARWNRRWAERGPGPSTPAPAEWLVENSSLLRGGDGRRALDVACGDGRNAMYLASLGFEVHAVDVSDVAIEAVATIAADRRLPVRAERLDLERDGLPAGCYEVVVQINYLQRDLLAALARAQSDGGILVIETFMRAPGGVGERPLNPHHLLRPGELVAAFADLDVVSHREGLAERSGRPVAVAGLVARRAP